MKPLCTHSAFRWLWLANLAASLATWTLGTALAVHIYTVTGSPAATSGLLVASTVPAIALGTVGGVIADRYRRDLLLKIISWSRVVTVAVLVIAGDHPIGMYAIALVQSAQMQFFTPAERATVADLVTGRDLPDALAANSAGANATRLAGPALGGILITWSGFTPTILTISVVFAIAATLLIFLPAIPATAETSTTILHDWVDGLRVTLTHRPARSVAVFQILDSIKEGPLTALFPVIMLGTIGSTAAYMGAVNSSFALTAILGAPVVSIITRRLGYRRPIAAGAIICGALLLVLACQPNRTSALLVFALSGFPFTIAWVAASTWLLANIQPSHRGRVTGTTSTLNAAATATFAAIAGAAAEILPATVVIGIAATVQMIAGPVFLLMTRGLRTRVNPAPGR